jgi:hypothetical protein
MNPASIHGELGTGTQPAMVDADLAAGFERAARAVDDRERRPRELQS